MSKSFSRLVIVAIIIIVIVLSAIAIYYFSQKGEIKKWWPIVKEFGIKAE